MEAGSPLSPVPKKPCPQRYPLERTRMAQNHAPSTTLPLIFMIYGLACLLLGAVWLVAEPELVTSYHYRPHTVAAAHLLILGFILSVVMGSVYQLVPVALETKLFSEKLVCWHAAFHLVGVTLMVPMFAVWDMKQVGHAGSFIYFGMLFFVYNLARTLGRVAKPNVIAAFVVAALLWLFLTMTAGLMLAANKFWPFLPPNPIGLMHAHAHLGVVGIFVMLIVGVSLKLIPMFALSELQSEARAWWILILINGGLAWLVSAIVAQLPVAAAVCGGLIGLGLVIYGVEVVAILRARKRRTLDWGLVMFLTAVTLLAPTALCGGLILEWSEEPTAWTMQLESVYALLGLFGVVIFAILGMLYKILPFLVWFRSYSPHIGRAQIPALADLYSARLQAVGFWLYLMALVVVCVGTLESNALISRLGAILWLVSVGVFAVNAGLILRHWWFPQMSPFPSAKPEVNAI